MATGAMMRRAPTETVAAKEESPVAGVSWAAVCAGAFAAGGLSLILMVLGAGVGLSAISPWPNGEADATRASALSIVWVILVQVVSSAIGGYLAGRLRTKWVALHTHEVYFRDTAHGFITWAVALVLSIAMVALSALAAAPSRQSAAAESQTGGYYVDMLFRSDNPAVERSDVTGRLEAAQILRHAIRNPDTPKEDESYLASLVTAESGLSREQAEQRVAQTIRANRESVDTARKAIAHSLYWLFLAFLMGAFCASYAATVGGRQRDLMENRAAAAAV